MPAAPAAEAVVVPGSAKPSKERADVFLSVSKAMSNYYAKKHTVSVRVCLAVYFF